MELDYKDNYFILRGATDWREIQRTEGWDVVQKSLGTASPLIVSPVDYAAHKYYNIANEAAKARLAHIHKEVEASRLIESGAHIDCPDGLELYPFQKANVEYVLRRQHALIGDEPGLGKTPTAICVANELAAKNILVICPANIRLQWVERIREWSTIRGRYHIYPILKSSDGVHPRAEWTIISYNLVSSPAIAEALKMRHWDLVIMDEAHYVKTPTSQRTRSCLGDEGIIQNAEHVLALTGTPLPNRPSECFTLSKALCWEAIDFMPEKQFRERFNPQDRGSHREQVGRLPELNARLRANYMCRHRKRDVLTQLPAIRHDIVHIEENGDIRKALEAERLLDIDPTDMRSTPVEVLGHISTVRKMMGVAKAPQVAEYASMVLDGGVHKLVIFAWHIEVLDILEKKLSKYGPMRIDGRVPPVTRQHRVDTFINYPNVRVFLGNLQSIGVGVDGLQRVCSRAIFAEASWTPADNDQGVGRLERFGQENPILIDYMVAQGSYDEKVLGKALDKLQNIHSVLDHNYQEGQNQ